MPDKSHAIRGCHAAWLLWAIGGSAGAQVTTPDPPLQETIIVRGKRLIDIGPLPGLAVTKDQIPANIQSATQEEIQESRALNIGDYMNTQLQGVSISDYSGNPFQMDVNYRGFTASPQVGTPQGLSVFFDGVRVNEPFGDVVNWDMIPLNAIERFDLFPGSNPIFGLNTLGGAISIRSRSGFTLQGIEASVTGGSWQRKQLQLAAGANNGEFAAFGALTVFKEAGWRDDSPSRVDQFYGRIDWALERATLTAAVLAANNDLVGNGLIPLESYQQRAETVFTSPDESRSRLLQLSLSAAYDVSETTNITGRLYRRKSDRSGYNGDVNEDFQDFGANDTVADWRRVNPTLPICQFTPNGISNPGGPNPLNGPIGVNCDYVGLAPSPFAGMPRNGGYLNRTGQQTSGVADGGTPTGLITRTVLEQVADGFGAQFNWNAEQHKAMFGAAIDRTRADYRMTQRLGLINADHGVYADPDDIDGVFGAAFTDVVGNQFDGRQDTESVYLSDVWSVQKNLHITIAGRYNHTHVSTHVGSRARTLGDLDDLAAALPRYILCPTTDPSSCPSAPAVVLDPATTQLQPTNEAAGFNSFNPSLGFNWLPTPVLNLFGNLSRGSRVPSVVELGCALDLTPADIVPGNPNIGQAPRSLLGSACSLPTTLSGDPFLPQIRATSGELGARGRLGSQWEWNASVYRTDLKNDIYFVGAGSGRSYFDTIGKTRRRGFEVGVKGTAGAFDLSSNYSFVDATFQSTFYMLSPYNSSADFDQNSRTLLGDPDQLAYPIQLLPSATAGANRGLGTFKNIRVDPGARLPGIPAHNVNATAGWRVIAPWRLALTVVAHSGSYVRGNDNNQHRPGGSDQQIGQYYCTIGSCAIPGETAYRQITVPVGKPFDNKGWVPGFATFNFNSSYRLARHWEMNLLITNLFDKQYFTAGRLGVNPFTSPTVGQTDASGFNYDSAEWRNTTFVGPGSPRAFFLSLSYSPELK